MPSKPKLKPRTKPAEERREDLMNSAERLFLEQGVGATTIEQITTGADVAKGTFYLHFSSKEDVLEALRNRFIASLLESIRQAVDKQKEDDWQGRLAAWCKACVSAYLDAARLHHVVFYEVPPPTREGLTNNVIIDYLTDLLAGGARAKAWSVTSPRLTAVFLFSAFHGVIVEEMTSEKRVSKARLAGEISAHFFRTLGI